MRVNNGFPQLIGINAELCEKSALENVALSVVLPVHSESDLAIDWLKELCERRHALLNHQMIVIRHY
jgi:hypothetical protein